MNTCRANGIVGIQGIDTRALVRHLRDHGAQEGIISTVDRRVPKSWSPKPKLRRAWSDEIWLRMYLRTSRTTGTKGCGDWKAATSSAMARRRCQAQPQGQLRRASIFCRRLRLWHQVQHSAQSRRGGLPGESRAGVDAGERGAGAESRRHFSLQRSRRSRRRALCQRKCSEV